MILDRAQDIFFLEVCAYSMSCANRDELFTVRAEQPFHCRVDQRGFRKLQEYLTQGPAAMQTHPG